MGERKQFQEEQFGLQAYSIEVEVIGNNGTVVVQNMGNLYNDALTYSTAWKWKSSETTEQSSSKIWATSTMMRSHTVQQEQKLSCTRFPEDQTSTSPWPRTHLARVVL